MIKKYRVWDKNKKSWVSCNVVIDFSGLLFWTFGYESRLIDDPETYDVQYSTGLLDKKANEIYEGDMFNYRWQILIIEYVNDMFHCKSTKYKNLSGGNYRLDSLKKECAVIGNIHENPELRPWPAQ